MCQYAERILKNAAEMHGCSCEIKLMGAADSAASDLDFAEQIRTVCREKMGQTVSDTLSVKAGGSEDVCYMMARVQQCGGKASFFRSCTVFAGPAHNRRFDIGEEVLGNAVKSFCAITAHLLG